jgi:hypothetical protein
VRSRCRAAGAIEPASAADTLAICISDSAPSIMRAPPEHEDDDDGCRRSSAISTRPGQLLAGHDAHAAADEAVLHCGDHHVEPVEASRGHDHRVVEAVALDGLLQPFPIGLGVGELQRVGRAEVAKCSA